MDAFTKEELIRLLETRSGSHVSIYIPAHRESDQAQQDSIRLKNALQEAGRRLCKGQLRDSEAEELLNPAMTLLGDTIFWQHQSDGLAVFLSPTIFRSYCLPLTFEELVVVARRFHVKPLLPLLSDDDRFYILALSQNSVRLLQGSRYKASKLPQGDLPASLAYALRWDDPEKQLQWHTNTGALSGRGRAAIFHGHSTASGDDSKNNILRYFRQIDNGLSELISDGYPPLILAGVDYLLPIYKEANTYPRLVDEGIVGNPETLSAKELHRRAWDIIAPRFVQARQEAVATYCQRAGVESKKASDDLKIILSAAYQGRVDTLFVAVGEQVWGSIDPEDGAVTEYGEPHMDNADLLDIAAAQTFLNGGTVYAVDPGNVPGAAMAAAVFRY
ncbi:MAG: hypothetical protein JXB07_20725 [Anaerolineae bacterium]|nr:hypothetical protein [Anaerolineae bacterium]